MGKEPQGSKINFLPPWPEGGNKPPWYVLHTLSPDDTVDNDATTEKIALVLSGGGAKGSFQVGALDYIYNVKFANLGIEHPSAIVGSSVGALNAVKLAEGQPTSFDELKSIWLDRLHANSDMWEFEPWTEGLPERFQNYLVSASEILEDTRNLLDALKPWEVADFGVDMLPWAISPVPFFTLGIRSFLIASDVVDEIEKVEKAIEKDRVKSILNLNPVIKLLNDRNFLDLQKIEESNVELYLCMVSLDSGEVSYINKYGVFNLRSENGEFQIDLRYGVLASAAFPVIFPPLEFADHLFVDGGVREIVPLSRALETHPDKVYAISASPKLTRKPFSDAARLASGDKAANLVEIGIRAANDIALDEIQENDLGGRSSDPLSSAGQDVKIIRPTIRVHGLLTIEPSLIDINMAHGYFRAFEEIDAADSLPRQTALSINGINDSIIKIRKEILELERTLHKKTTIYDDDNRRHIQIVYPGEERRVWRDGGLPSRAAQWKSTIINNMQTLRTLKRELRALMAQVLGLGGVLPPDSNRWFTQWERVPPRVEMISSSPWEEVVIEGFRIAPRNSQTERYDGPWEFRQIAGFVIEGEPTPPAL